MAGEQQSGPASAGPPPTIFHRVTEALGRIGTLWILVVMLLVNADVAGRYFLNSPIPGVPELVALSIVGIVYLQLPHTLRLERFIRSDVLILPLIEKRPRAGYLLQAVTHAFGALMCALIFWYVAPNFVEAWNEGDYVGAAGVFTAPKWPIYLIVTVCTALTALQFLRHVLRDLAVASGRMAPPPLPGAAGE
ncbi:TRAP transporter small permease subunit [Desertibaculum subflavum]|uniref:TRAP transporter small permease subunit n=1 Tax=Desertibaculum subflavum TaxID=2268458 RepID=UPI0013C454A5